MEAKPAPDAGFLADPGRMAERENRFPFQRYWCSWDELAGFRRIEVAPVDTRHIEDMAWWKALTPEARADLEKDVPGMADRMRKAFEKAIREDQKKRFELADEAGPATARLELALVEMVPSKVFLKAATKVGGFFIPGVGLLGMFGSASAAMEGRIRDTATGKVVCMFADREKARASLIHVQDYTWYGNVYEIMDEWAKDFVEIAGADHPVEEVTDGRPFTLKPW